MYQFLDEIKPIPTPPKPKIICYTCNFDKYDFNNMGKYPFVDSLILDDFKYKENKIHATDKFSQYDYSLYIDGNIQLKIDPWKIIKNLLLDDVTVVRNGYCIYQTDNRHNLFKELKVPVGVQSYSDYFIIRKHNGKVKNMEHFWDKHNNLSLACYLSGIIPKILDGEKIYNIIPHRKTIVSIIWG